MPMPCSNLLVALLLTVTTSAQRSAIDAYQRDEATLPEVVGLCTGSMELKNQLVLKMLIEAIDGCQAD